MNIIKLYEFFDNTTNYCIVEEYCKEGELYDILKRQGPGFPEKSVCYIMQQVLSAVAYMHDNNIVNRDIRAENILVESIRVEVDNGEEIPYLEVRVKNFKSARTFRKGNKLNKKVGNVFF